MKNTNTILHVCSLYMDLSWILAEDFFEILPIAKANGWVHQNEGKLKEVTERLQLLKNTLLHEKTNNNTTTDPVFSER